MKILDNNRGQGLTEYLILLILIAVVSIGVTRTMGTTIRQKMLKAREQINGVEIPQN